jgi:hypothetical protein
MKAGKEEEIVAVVELKQIVLRQPRYEINTIPDLLRQSVSLQPSFLRTTTDYGVVNRAFGIFFKSIAKAWMAM